MTTLKTLEVWTAQTLCNIGILLSVISFLLHAGRPYFERASSRLAIRVAHDLWWLAYIALRDGSLFAAAIVGLWTLNLDLMADIKIGLPFVPLGTVLLCAALLWKVFRTRDDEHERAGVLFVMAGAIANMLGYVLVMEAPGDEYRASRTAFWKAMLSLRSNANAGLATVTFYVACAILIAMAIVASLVAFRKAAASRRTP